MLMVNADAVNSVFYRDTIPVACANQQYSLIFYAAFPGNSAYQTKCNGFGGFKYPRVKINIRDAATGLIITQNSTPDIISNSWSQYGLKFVMPSGFSSVVIELVNDGLGGCGNDILIDDIQYGLCDPVPTIVVGSNSNGCLGATSIISSNITDGGVIPGTKEYQWQVSSDGTLFTDISGATAADLTLSPLAASDVNKYYRVLVAASGNMSSTACRYVSSPYLLVSKTASTNPVSISISRNNICPGDAVTLQVNGGTTGTNATWRWYSGSCGGTFVGTGNSITINPSVTTTYYVRAEGDCNTTTCVSRTITIACDIDDDNDGITDLAESGGVDPFNDTDLDGILDYRDSDYAGFSDSNGDGVNDRFDNDLDGIINSLDLDSDNDGIPDVVESGGVDANGDGLIDNYSDADGDGLSQNVDGSSIGVSGSGSGLGLVDTDGDGVPNLFDLDSDNDGIPDVVEAGGTDSNNDGRIDNYTDTDQDGFSQNVDGDPNNDSIADNSSNTLLRTGSDGNGDGRADSYPYKNFDSDSRANAYDLDSDNDGISDTREAGFGDANNDGFTDGTKGIDGWDDSIDARASLGLLNSDADANLDYLDIDADNDGIPDNVEGMSTSSYRLPAYVDSDGDGIDNSYDSYNGFGGNGITPNDQDGDGVPDYIDIDTDGDGINDIVEGNDLNGNCAYDDVISLTLIDTDGDGLDNRFDNLNGSIKGTSPAMGNLGSFAGDPTPGSRTAVQTCRLNASDRDWRFVTNALSLDFMAMQAQWAPAGAKVKWVVTCSAVIDHFIVERSSDGRQFFAVGSIPGTGTSCNAAPFEYLDSMNIQGGQKYQYRIRSVTLINGDKLGPVVKLSAGTDPEVRVFPNPAKQFVKVSIPAHQAGYGTIRILNVSGVELNRSVHELRKGVNTITLRHIASLAPGSYYVQVDTGEKLVIEKILVQ